MNKNTKIRNEEPTRKSKRVRNHPLKTQGPESLYIYNLGNDSMYCDNEEDIEKFYFENQKGSYLPYIPEIDSLQNSHNNNRKK